MNKDPNSFVESRLSSLDPSSDWKPNAAKGWAQLQQRQWEGIPTPPRWKRKSTWVAALIFVGGLTMTFPSSRAFAQEAVTAGVEGAGDLFHGVCAHLLFLHNMIFHFLHG